MTWHVKVFARPPVLGTRFVRVWKAPLTHSSCRSLMSLRGVLKAVAIRLALCPVHTSLLVILSIRKEGT